MSEPTDARVDAGLHELLGNVRPPDLRSAIRSRIALGERVADVSEPTRHHAWSVVAAAALVMLGVAIVATLAVLDRGESTADVPAGGRSDDDRAFVRGLEALRTLPADTVALTVAGIGGRDLPELGRFRELADLELRIACDDADLRALRRLPKLRRLAVPASDAIDGSGFAALESLPILEQLDLSSTGVDAAGLRAVARLPALTWLRLYHCERIDDAAMEVLATMRGLRALDVSWCHGVSRDAFAKLAALTGLQELRIAHNDSGARSSFLPLPGNADGVGVDDGVLAALGALADLRVLSLERCFSLTSDSMPVLASFARLEDLDLTATAFAAAAVENAPVALRSLRLAMAGADDALLRRIAERFGELEFLDLSSSEEVTAAGLRALGALPHLRRLAMTDRRDASEFVAGLSVLTALRTLDLQLVEGLKPEHFAAIAKLPGLEELDVGGAWHLDADHFAALAAAPALRRLRIGRRGVWSSTKPITAIPQSLSSEVLRALAPLRLELLDLRDLPRFFAMRLPNAPFVVDEAQGPDAIAIVRRIANDQWPGCRVVLPDWSAFDVPR